MVMIRYNSSKYQKRKRKTSHTSADGAAGPSTGEYRRRMSLCELIGRGAGVGEPLAGSWGVRIGDSVVGDSVVGDVVVGDAVVGDSVITQSNNTRVGIHVERHDEQNTEQMLSKT